MIDSFDGAYAFLSNFYPCTVQYAGVDYPSVEHAYQAAKCADPQLREVFTTGTAAQAKRRGRGVELRSNWEDMKEDIMLHLLRQKFLNNMAMRTRLSETGNHELVEGNWWGDTYWGVCRGKGQNRLGILLMRVRGEL